MRWKKLKQLGYVKKLDLWVPHQLKEIHLTQRISICDSLLERDEIGPFLKRLITGDQKWIVYNNVNGKRSWMMKDEPDQTTPKAEIHQKRLCCQFGRNIKEFCTLNFYQETKRLIQTWTFNNSPNWAMQLKESCQKWQIVRVLSSSMMMQSPTHIWSLAKNYWNLGWPYSPDLAPSDYHLFRSIQDSLNGKIFNDTNDVKSYLIQFFAGKNQKFYVHGIMILPERWQKIINKNGQYLIE